MSKAIKEASNKVEYTEQIKRAKQISFSGDPVAHVENDFPEMTSEFRRLQKKQYDLFCKKQHDYGPGNIAVGTQLLTEGEIKLSLTGLWFRMNDKIQRLKNLLMSGRKNAVEGEPMEDAFLDVSNYGIMATIVKNGKWGK